MGIFSRKRPVSTEGLRLDQSWDDLALDAAYAAVRAGELPAGLELLKASPINTDQRAIRMTGLSNAAIGRSEQLELLLQAMPGDPELLVWLAQTLVFEAWEVRTAQRAVNVSSQQFATFHDILRTANDVVTAAIDAAPDDATPWCPLQWVALGLQFSARDKELVFANAVARQPDSYLVHARQVQILTPKWTRGPVEDLLRFGWDTAYKTQPYRALGTGILSLVFAEAMVDIGQDETRPRAEREARMGSLILDRRDLLLDARANWWRSGHQPEPADIEAHQAAAFIFRMLSRPELAMEHAAHTKGRVSFNPWAMSAEGHDALTGFATAVADKMRI